MNKDPDDGRLRIFLLETCKSRGLSLRRLSFNSGLSPGTVYGMIKRKYQPTLYSLNRLADYLGVKREYLWQLAGLLGDADGVPGDTRLQSQLARVDELPEDIRAHVVAGIEPILAIAEKASRHPQLWLTHQ